METSLHRELKQFYAGEGAQIEARLGKFRIDVINGEQLVEIQHGSLAAIRDKISHLLADHSVLIVKPIIARKVLCKHASETGHVVSRRLSPKRGCLLDLFEELVYFTKVFPHPRLTIEVALVEVEESRCPGHGRRRRWRRNDQVVMDQRLTAVNETWRFSSTADLLTLLPRDLPAVFDTAQLAAGLGVPRHVAQRIAFCLRETGAVQPAGKLRNSLLYRLPAMAAVVEKKRKRRAA